MDGKRVTPARALWIVKCARGRVTRAWARELTAGGSQKMCLMGSRLQEMGEGRATLATGCEQERAPKT
eukprot:365479-Chlamydomonas_euryale.AAC.13